MRRRRISSTRRPDPQGDIVAFLSDPLSYGLSHDTDIAHRETHIAHVFLVGPDAYKLKKAVKLPFLDFSTLPLRHAACEAELRLNRRTAPDLYVDLLAVRRGASGDLNLDGDGEVVDWLVHMRRFADDALLDDVARAGEFGLPLARRLADAIAAFHADAEVLPEVDWAAELTRTAGMNAKVIDAFVPSVFPASDVDALNTRLKSMLHVRRAFFSERGRRGAVRHCHGDLHLRNIFLDDGEPRLFDAIEFDDRLARIDVLYDMAFLLMDLWHRDLKQAANCVLSRYLLHTRDFAGLAGLPVYLSLRAGIRAHVSATTARSAPDGYKFEEEARQYLVIARDFLTPRSPVLIGVGGVSGTGKSTIAAALAPDIGATPGAVCLRSDEARKALMGVEPETSLPSDAYAPEVSARVYDALRQHAATSLAAGAAVIVDGVHGDTESRAKLEAVALAAGVPFVGIWLDAPADLLAHRIEERVGDASDADVEVMRAQMRSDLGPINWHRIAAGGSVVDTVAAARAILPPAATD